ncbi:hypothetical protein ABEF93_005834 [Exophiala dermatitidis]
MSEYWKSTPKYWCKHCSTYVKDTPFERRQHENTGKHQGNLKRFLRDIQNNHERSEREKDRAKAEVERLSKVAGGNVPPTAASRTEPSTGRKPASGPPSAADLKKQWAQLAEMGIKVPEQARSEMAMPGEWQVVSKQTNNEAPAAESLSIGVRKRKAEDEEEEEEAEQTVTRHWGSTTRRYPGDDKSDLDDLLSATVSLKKEKNLPSSSQIKPEMSEPLKKEDNASPNEDNCRDAQSQSSKVENPPDEESKEGRTLVKGELDAASMSTPLNKVPEEVPVPVFKKRKAKAS